MMYFVFSRKTKLSIWLYEKASVKIKLFFVSNDVSHNSKHKKNAASFTRETSSGLSFVLYSIMKTPFYSQVTIYPLILSPEAV